MFTSCIYVLELEGGYYYVGKTNNIVQRFNSHKTVGCAWTRLHGEPKIVELYECTSIFDEDKYTLEYMNMRGVDYVRGGSYSNIVLSQEQRNNITRALRNANNLCMTCGQSDHFADTCPQSKELHSLKIKNGSSTRVDAETLTSNHSTEESNLTTENFNLIIANGHFDYGTTKPRYLPKNSAIDDEPGSDNFELEAYCPPIARHTQTTSSGCSRCGRISHTLDKCIAKSTVTGALL